MVAADGVTDRRVRLEAICRQAGVAILYAFGSRTDEVRQWLKDERPTLAAGPSDVDIAVKFLPQTEVGIDERVTLAIALEDLLAVDRVDLVDLEQADAFLAANAI
ncbi:MAG: nucleotidyltransferase domain-containing protein, partial [Anaerolineae bacterium]